MIHVDHMIDVECKCTTYWRSIMIYSVIQELDDDNLILCETFRLVASWYRCMYVVTHGAVATAKKWATAAKEFWTFPTVLNSGTDDKKESFHLRH